MNYYYIKFTRWNETLGDETVYVLLETKMDYPNCDLVKFEAAQWKAFWKQYPQWECKYNSKHLPQTNLEKLGNYWSTPSAGRIHRVKWTTKIEELKLC